MSAPLHYGVAPEVFAKFPGYLRGVVFATGVRNGPSPDTLVRLLRQAEASVRERVTQANPADHPRLAAWRNAFRDFGAKPSEHRASIEAMARRVLKGDELPAINALVDIGNIVSLRWLLPAGVHPTASLAQDLWLRPAREGDAFAPATRPGEVAPAETPPPGEIVFAEGPSVLTRRWVWRQAAGTQTEASATAVLFNIDGLPPTGADDVYGALADTQALVREFCAGETSSACLDAGQTSVTLRR